MLKKIMLTFLVLLVVGAVVFMLGPRIQADETIRPNQVPGKPDQLDAYLKKQESRFNDLRPQSNKQIIWANTSKTQTPLAVIYIHGWSATRMETAPLGEQIAKQLGANYFATRLTGHGRPGKELAKATVNDWLNDTVEAYNVGKVIGKKVIIIGTSTGATLATWLATRYKDNKDLLAIAMLSPNFSPNDQRSYIITWPWGLHIVKAMVGSQRSWKPYNADQGKHWTTSYPTEALAPMMGLVKLVDGIDLKAFRTPVLMMFSDGDKVISPKKIRKRFTEVGARLKKLSPLVPKGNLSNHVIAGKILAATFTPTVRKHTIDFLAQLPEVKAQLTANTTPRAKGSTSGTKPKAPEKAAPRKETKPIKRP